MWPGGGCLVPAGAAKAHGRVGLAGFCRWGVAPAQAPNGSLRGLPPSAPAIGRRTSAILGLPRPDLRPGPKPNQSLARPKPTTSNAPPLY
jgi:hypothetical protein